MVLGVTYKEVHDEVAPQAWSYDYEAAGNEAGEVDPNKHWHQGKDFNKSGINIDEAWAWLGTKGYAIQRRYKYVWGHGEIADWPPQPFAPIHIVGVQTSQSHAIVMESNGTLLDPNREPGTWSGTFAEYKAIEQVIGIWKVKEGLP